MTFMELMVAIALAAVLLTVAVPSFTAVINTNRQATIANTFLTSLHLARSEAVRRQARVVLCKSADGATCAANGRWDQGWIVFHDADNDAQVDVGEELIRVYEALPGTFAIGGNNPVANYVSYAQSGAARLTGGAWQMGTITLCRVAAGGRGCEADRHQRHRAAQGGEGERGELSMKEGCPSPRDKRWCCPVNSARIDRYIPWPARRADRSEQVGEIRSISVGKFYTSSLGVLITD